MISGAARRKSRPRKSWHRPRVTGEITESNLKSDITNADSCTADQSVALIRCLLGPVLEGEQNAGECSDDGDDGRQNDVTAATRPSPEASGLNVDSETGAGVHVLGNDLDRSVCSPDSEDESIQSSHDRNDPCTFIGDTSGTEYPGVEIATKLKPRQGFNRRRNSKRKRSRVSVNGVQKMDTEVLTDLETISDDTGLVGPASVAVKSLLADNDLPFQTHAKSNHISNKSQILGNKSPSRSKAKIRRDSMNASNRRKSGIRQPILTDDSDTPDPPPQNTLLAMKSLAAPFSSSSCKVNRQPVDEPSPEAELLNIAKLHLKRGGYQCPLCFLLTRDRHDLKRHLRTHSKERPYQCSLCNARYTRKWDFENHLQKHGIYDTKSAVDLPSLSVDESYNRFIERILEGVKLGLTGKELLSYSLADGGGDDVTADDVISDEITGDDVTA